MPGDKTLNPLFETIKREIIMAGGLISFARFMELALYCPQLGYYERKKDTVGRRGDYYTSVSVGPLFGELLAFQLADWLAESRLPAAGCRLMEAGAHDGKLAADILRWLCRQRPQLFERLQYLIIEPSELRRAWQRENLLEFGPHVGWLPQLPGQPELSGVIFSNELFDAMPVHRLGWDVAQRAWFEWGVAVKGDRFVWARMPASNPASNFKLQVPSDVLDVLPDQFTTEFSAGATLWWQQAARSLVAGKLLTIDYGLTAGEFFQPDRRGGTLRAYSRHQPGAELLAEVGEQDLTAHVNFTALQQTGELAGMKTDGLFTQSHFLTRIAKDIWEKPGSFGEWTTAHNRQFQTLVHPEHLGRSFRVLVQSR
jgi:SAM-dependent MidA family methyltransferase